MFAAGRVLTASRVEHPVPPVGLATAILTDNVRQVAVGHDGGRQVFFQLRLVVGVDPRRWGQGGRGGPVYVVQDGGGRRRGEGFQQPLLLQIKGGM